jgi:hypothetical protein
MERTSTWSGKVDAVLVLADFIAIAARNGADLVEGILTR